jgi:hypothetical protein
MVMKTLIRRVEKEEYFIIHVFTDRNTVPGRRSYCIYLSIVLLDLSTDRVRLGNSEYE